jgi:hypothetical protein
MSEMGSIIQGGGIVLSGALVFKLIDVALKMWATRHQKTETEVTPNPLGVVTEKKAEYVTKDEFAKHVLDNDRAHENLEARLNRNDRETSEIKGMLGTIIDDLRLIKNKLLTKGTK